MNDTQHTIGEILDNDADDILDRDAIHIAVLPVWTDEELHRGEMVHFVPGRIDRVKVSGKGEEVGIIDPFLHALTVPKNTRVWLFLKPNTVTGMRHHWSHPLVDGQGAVKQVLKRFGKVPDSEAWLRNFCGKYSIGYEELLEEAQKRHGEICAGNDLDDDVEPDSEYWEHLEEVTGKKFSKEHREGMSWRCAC